MSKVWDDEEDVDEVKDKDSYDDTSVNLITYMAKRFHLSILEKTIIIGFSLLLIACMTGFGLLCFKYGHTLEGIIIIAAFAIIIALVFLVKLYTSSSLEDIAKMQYGKALKVIEGDMSFDHQEMPMRCTLYEYAMEIKALDEDADDYKNIMDDLIEYKAITHLFKNATQTSLAIIFMDSRLKKHTLCLYSDNKPLKIVAIYNQIKSHCNPDIFEMSEKTKKDKEVSDESSKVERETHTGLA